MRLLAVLPLAFVFLLPMQPASQPRDLSGVVNPLVKKHRMPALGGAIVTSSGLRTVGVAGVRSWKDATQVTADDQWHIGSCTKTLTATLAARLVDAGVLTWDTTIGDVFGKSMPGIHPDWKGVSITLLLCHRSGADKNFPRALWDRMLQKGGTTREQRRFFVEEGLKTSPSTAPNTQTTYSNAGYLIAGAMLESLTNASWEELMMQKVFEPLGMTRTGFGPPGAAGKLDQPVGHTRGPDGWKPIGHGPEADNPPVVGPAGTVHTTLRDWAKFAAAHLRGARGDKTYLKEATWKKLHSEGGEGWGYAPGWVVAKQDWAGGTFLRHLGGNTYWLAEASFAPDKDMAVLIVSNLGDDVLEKPFKELLAALVAEHQAHPK